MAIDKQGLKVIKESAERKAPVFFSADGLEIIFQTLILGIDNNRLILANKVSPEFILQVKDASRFTVQVQMHRFFSDQILTDGVNIVFPLESLSVIEETRQAQRFPFDPGEKVVLEVTNPFDGETVLSKTVMDMSSAGLSIRTPFPSSVFAPGTYFRDMKISIDGEPYAKTNGSVVYIRRFLSLNGKSYCQVGFRFDQAPSKSL